MENLSLSEQILYCTVKITCLKNNKSTISTGTGFIYGACQNGDAHYPVLVTNKHVINDSEQCSLLFHLRDENNHVLNSNMEYIIEADSRSVWIPHPNPNIDLAILNLSPIFLDISKSAKEIFYTCLDSNMIPTEQDINSFSAIEDILMIGYPNGILDIKNNLPIVRKGITATSYYNDFNGSKQFLADISCYPGSSGSPIIVLQEGISKDKYGNLSIGQSKLKLLGITSSVFLNTITGDLIVEETSSVKPSLRIPNNLAVIIKSDQLLYFDQIIRNQL